MPKFGLTEGEEKAAANIFLALWNLRGNMLLLVHFVAKGHGLFKQPTEKTRKSE